MALATDLYELNMAASYLRRGTFAANAGTYGASPSESAIAAADCFAEPAISDVVDLHALPGRQWRPA